MKGKIMIALVVLALAFGTVLAACDDGDFPDFKPVDGNKTILDKPATTGGDADAIKGALTPLDPTP